MILTRSISPLRGPGMCPCVCRTGQQGKHAFVEVAAAAVTVEDCWRLVDTSERTQRHCIMLENCCWQKMELFVS